MTPKVSSQSRRPAESETRRRLCHIRSRPCRLAIVLLAAIPTTLLAQTKDLGQATQYYKQPTPKFGFVPGPKPGGGDVRVTLAPGGRVVTEKDEYSILEGDVTIEYQDIKLRADKVTHNLRTKDVVADGHVIIDQGPTRITADRAVYNMESKTGTFFHATGALEPSMYFTGEKIEKIGDETYRMTNGVFTSCDLDNPSWSFHVRQAEITLDDYAHMRDVTFRAHHMPIFWAPRLIWPTKRDRSRGFLIPRVNYSGEFGTRFEIGYFVPVGDSADVTLYGDLNTEGYNGLGIDLRYLPTPNIKTGELNAFAVHDPEGNREQWRYTYKHAQDNLPGGFRGVVDVEDFSDLDFFRKYSRDPGLNVKSQIYSSAYLTKNGPNYSLNLLADRREILLGSGATPTTERSQSFEQLPSLQFRSYPTRVGATPLYFALESSASHLVTNATGLATGPNADYFRGDIFPTLSLQLRTPAWFSIRPQISARETYYTSSLTPIDPASPFTPQEAVKESLSRFYAQGQVDVVGPSFSRVFNREILGFNKLKHVIEPRFRYVYTSSLDDEDRAIRFDTVDVIPFVRDSVEYSLTQRLLGREAGNPSAREILSFSLRQTVSLSKIDTQPGTFTTDTGKFSPLTASLHVNPYQTVTFDANAAFGNVSHQLDQSSLSANLIGSGKNADKYLSFTWFATYRPPPTPEQPVVFDSSSSQVRLSAGSTIFRDRIRGDVQLNFDAKRGTFLEQRYLFGMNAACYGVALEFRRYVVYDPAPRALFTYGIAVTLKNVGTVGSH
jgi:LPS-assembly protein